MPSLAPFGQAVSEKIFLTLANQKKELFLAAMFIGQMEPNLAVSIYVRSSIEFLHFVPFGLQTWPPRLILFSDWLMINKSSPLKQLGIDGPWVCPFQNCVRQPHPPFKMAAVAKSQNELKF